MCGSVFKHLHGKEINRFQRTYVQEGYCWNSLYYFVIYTAIELHIIYKKLIRQCFYFEFQEELNKHLHSNIF